MSSSAHLILGSKVFGWPDQGMVFDVATQLGTLLAVLVYFRKDQVNIVRPWIDTGIDEEPARRLGKILIISSAAHHSSKPKPMVVSAII